MDEFYLASSVPGSWYGSCWPTVTLSWFTGTLKQTEACVTSITCAFPSMTSPNVCCVKGLLDELLPCANLIIQTTVANLPVLQFVPLFLQAAVAFFFPTSSLTLSWIWQFQHSKLCLVPLANSRQYWVIECKWAVTKPLRDRHPVVIDENRILPGYTWTGQIKLQFRPASCPFLDNLTSPGWKVTGASNCSNEGFQSISVFQ